MADGGDGTVDILLSFGFDSFPCQTVDALRRPHWGRFAIKGDTAVIELAETCGLARIPVDERAPWDSSTLGIGMAARAALEQGVRHVYIAVGGSASVDGGLGLLAGLGFTTLTFDGQQVDPSARGLLSVHSVGESPLASRIEACEWTILVDVESPACGPDGAARVFGPQKGFGVPECLALDDAMARWCAIAGGKGQGPQLQGLPGAGAAGGVAVAAVGLLGARIESGAQELVKLTGLAELMAGVDVVVIGEGHLDGQTMAGKAPSVVAALARQLGKPVFAIAGGCDITPDAAVELGIADIRDIVTLTDASGSREEGMADPRLWLAVAAVSLAQRIRLLAAD